MNRYRITQSLLSSFDWSFKLENGYEEFLKTLKRENKSKTKAMVEGLLFEDMVTKYCEKGVIDTQHKWHDGIKQIGDIVKGGVFQVALSKDIKIDNLEFHLYGILDNLKAGVIYDIKFSKKYKFGKYLDSPQHPMYFELCSEADVFHYLIYNGKDVFIETYRRDETSDIKKEISIFIKWLEKFELLKDYKKHWQSKH